MIMNLTKEKIDNIDNLINLLLSPEDNVELVRQLLKSQEKKPSDLFYYCFPKMTEKRHVTESHSKRQFFSRNELHFHNSYMKILLSKPIDKSRGSLYVIVELQFPIMFNTNWLGNYADNILGCIKILIEFLQERNLWNNETHQMRLQ